MRTKLLISNEKSTYFDFFATDSGNRLATRDKGEIDIHGITELAEAESTHAKTVCHELSLTLTVIHAPTEISVTNTIKKLLDAENHI